MTQKLPICGNAVGVRGANVAPSPPVPKKKVSCEDCYFHKHMLCALNLTEPCPTFRSAEKGLKPERQLAFVFRTERTRAVYAFPPPS